MEHDSKKFSQLKYAAPQDYQHQKSSLTENTQVARMRQYQS
jgi:hypothetical protein